MFPLIPVPTLQAKALALEAQPFALRDVKVEGGPFVRAREANAAYLLKLEPQRFLHGFRKNAGLTPKAEIYGGWESQGVAGQTFGHYMTALSLQYAASGDPRFRAKLDESIAGLKECQAQRKDGYIGAIPDGDRIWSEIRAGKITSQGFDLNGGWVPWYTMHKVFTGLLDAHTLAGNPDALPIARRLGDWAIEVTAKLDDASWQKMLACEHGGMNEAMANLYALTGERRYLELSRKFDHRAILDPLRQGRDELDGKHSNTQVPKLIGLARLYELEGVEQDRKAAEFFWTRVVNHHSYAMGGNSNFEHFGPPDRFRDRLSPNSAETCNTYNMLKLSRHLFGWQPRVEVADFYERALYNHILGAQNPETGMLCYYIPLEQGGHRTHSTPFDSFWCCVGTGIENHTKYADSIYYHQGKNRLWVNGYIPSSLEWKDAGVTLRQQTRYPEEGAVALEVVDGSADFTLSLRHPKWADGSIEVKVNGEAAATSTVAGSYIDVQRSWKKGDRVEFAIPMRLRREAMPDDPTQVALFYGPVALAADMGPVSEPKPRPVALIDQGQPLESMLQAEEGGWRTVTGVAKPNDLKFLPFWSLQDRRYSLYVDWIDEAEWQKREFRFQEEEARRKELEANTIDVLRIGEMQPERDHELKGEKTDAGDSAAGKWRHAVDGGWFSFRLTVDPDVANALAISYWSGDGAGRSFDILIDGVKVATERLMRSEPLRLYDVLYPIPADLIKGKDRVTVKLQALPGQTAGGIFGARTIRVKPN